MKRFTKLRFVLKFFGPSATLRLELPGVFRALYREGGGVQEVQTVHLRINARVRVANAVRANVAAVPAQERVVLVVRRVHTGLVQRDVDRQTSAAAQDAESCQPPRNPSTTLFQLAPNLWLRPTGSWNTVDQVKR